MGKVILVGVTLFLAGCTTGQSTFCDAAKYITLEKGEIKKLSLKTKQGILAHNRKVKKFCR